MVDIEINELVAIGLAIRSLRKRARLSQEDLAATTGLHRSYISGIECGTRNVGLKNIYVLSRALSVSVIELVTLTEEFRNTLVKSMKR